MDATGIGFKDGNGARVVFGMFVSRLMRRDASDGVNDRFDPFALAADADSENNRDGS